VTVATEAGKAFVTIEYDPRSLAALGAKTKATGESLGSTLTSAGKKAGKALAIGVGVGAAVAGFGLFKAAQAAGDFQTELNKLQAVSGATGSQMKDVSALAIQLGKDIHLPATSAADAAVAMTELAKGGLSVKDSMDAARGTLQLAAAGEVDVGTAAGITANALNAFALNGRQAGHVADLLAGAANASTGEIGDFAEGLQFAGSASKAAGQDIDLVVAALAEMANAGLSGSVAGSSLAQSMRSLEAPTAKARDAMHKFGIDVFDSAGNMLPLDKIAQVFTSHLGDLTQQQQNQALATIFGSRAVQAARIVFLGGADALDQYRDKVGKAGNAQRLAEARTKGFQGAIQAFTSNVETLGITIGLKLLPPLTEAVRHMTDFVTFLGRISEADSPTIALHIAFEGVKEAAAGLVKTIKDALFGSTQTITIPVQLGKQARSTTRDTKGLIDSLRDTLQSAVKGVDWTGVGKTIGAAIGNSIRITTEFVDTLVTDIIAAVNEHKGQLAEVGLGIALSMVAALLDPSFWLKNWRTVAAIAFGALTLAFLPAKFVQALRGIKVIGPLIIEPLLRLGNLLRPAVQRIFTIILDELDSQFPRVVGGFAVLGRAVVNTIRGRLSAVPGVFQDTFEMALRFLVRFVADGARAAGRIAAAILRPFGDLAGRIAGPIIRFGRRLLDALGGFVSQVFSKGSEIGGAIIDGILSAIRSGASSIVDAVKGIGTQALDGIKSILHIGSPSRVFADQVGKPIVEGIIVGIQDQQSNLDAVLREAVKPPPVPSSIAPSVLTPSMVSQAVLAVRGASTTVTSQQQPTIVKFPDRFKADLTIDLGDGLQQTVEAQFRALDLQLAAGSQA